MRDIVELLEATVAQDKQQTLDLVEEAKKDREINETKEGCDKKLEELSAVIRDSLDAKGVEVGKETDKKMQSLINMHLRIPNLVGDRGEPFLTVSEYLGTTHIKNKEAFSDHQALIRDVSQQGKLSLRNLEKALKDSIEEQVEEAETRMKKGLETFNETVGSELKQAQELIDKLNSEVNSINENQGGQIQKHEASISSLLE